MLVNFPRRQALVLGAFLSALLLILAVFSVSIGNKSQSAHSVPTASALPTLSPGDPLNTFYHQKLTWTSCKDGFDCADLTVPLDYAHPSAHSINLKVVRHKSSQAHVLGSLVLNPGGPGGSGIEYARAYLYVMSETLIKNFDIVGFDPRGVGGSTPVRCMTDKQLDAYVSADQSPDNQAEINQYVALAKELAMGCAATSPLIYRYMDTVSAARDIDILRVALGDKKLNWFGKSYGTFLGATYAGLFPTHVGRMMLDGAIDPTLTNAQLTHGQALGFENALHRFVADCATQSDCPLKPGSAGLQQVADMLAKLDTHPGHLANGRLFTQALGFTGVVGGLYDVSYGWPDLRSSLADALKGDYRSLATSADYYITRDDKGHFTDNSNEAIAAVNCLDRPDRATVAQTEKLAQAWSKQAPVFGTSLAWGNLGCTYWPIPATGVPDVITAAGSPTIVVVGTVNDPATPYPWAVALSKQLSKGILLTYTGDGHTAYYQGSTCVDDYIDHFYLTGNAKAGVSCKPDTESTNS